MRYLLALIITLTSTISPLYGSDTRISADMGLGTGMPNNLAAQFSASIDFLQQEERDYRFSLVYQAAGKISFCHDECPRSTGFASVMVYGGVSKSHFSNYTGYLLSVNLGVGALKWEENNTRGIDLGAKAEARAYLGPLYIFINGNISRGGFTTMVGFGLSSF